MWKLKDLRDLRFMWKLRIRHAWRWLTHPRPRLWAYAVVIIIAAALGISRSFFEFGDPGLIDNFFAGAVEVAFTVFVVDFLLRNHEQQRTMPIRFVLLKEVADIYRQLRLLWATMVKATGHLSLEDS